MLPMLPMLPILPMLPKNGNVDVRIRCNFSSSGKEMVALVTL